MINFRTRLLVASFALGAAAGQTAMAAYLSPQFRATAAAMSKSGALRTGKATKATIDAFVGAYRAGHGAAKLGGRMAPPTARFMGRGVGVSARIGGRVLTSPVGRAGRFVARKMLFPLVVWGAIKGAHKEGAKAQRSGAGFKGIFAQSLKGSILGAIGLPSDVIFG